MRLLHQAIAGLLAILSMCGIALAQKQGGTLRIYHRDSPASMSTYEETTISTSIPMMGVFNNLIVFDPSEPQNRLDNIIPDLAERWSWSDDGKDLTFKLRKESNGTTASLLLHLMLSVRGSCCWEKPKKSSASTRVKHGGSI
jgi:ABC-type transport system substrate-binding protein